MNKHDVDNMQDIFNIYIHKCMYFKGVQDFDSLGDSNGFNLAQPFILHLLLMKISHFYIITIEFIFGRYTKLKKKI